MIQKKIKDLITVPDVKTVIQLSDTEDPALRDFLSRSFLITDEVGNILQAFFRRVTENQGSGFFLQGNFGSGKSHLLSVLSLLFRYSKAWQPLLAQDEGLAEYAEKVNNKKYITLDISLVKHSARQHLEDIVIKKINDFLKKEGLTSYLFKGEEEFIQDIKQLVGKERHSSKFRAFLRENDIEKESLFSPGNLFLIEELVERLNLSYGFRYDREQVFNILDDLIAEKGYSGIIFLFDELSEFLRSKTDGRSFNEDIRFLQFLGELTAHQSCWVMASLQEEIEKTGDATPEEFNKIKDRFKYFKLTGSHVEELVSRRLIQQKDGAEEEIAKIYQKYSSCFAQWPVSEKQFADFYPVNPLTINLLDNLKSLFSEHRGIVDFIHYRLKGDPDRNLEGMLEKPAENLLTPDKIFDHFTGRIRERMETAPYFEKVFSFYQQEIDSILEKEEVPAGLGLIKLLILARISPLEKDFSICELGNLLLERITELEPVANYEYLDDILQRLFQKGAYLNYQPGDTVLDNIYQIDLQADVNLLIERKTEFYQSNLFADDRRIFTRLAPYVDLRTLPLAAFFEKDKSIREIYWHHTRHSGYRIFMPFNEISIDDLEKTADRLQTTEIDFCLIIGYAHRIEEMDKYLKEVLLPELRGERGQGFLFWQPQAPAETDFLEEALARVLLFDEYREKQGENADRIRQTLDNYLQEDQDKIAEIYAQAYLNGRIITPQGEVIKPGEIRYKNFQDLFYRLASVVLSELFPQHESIAPYQSVLSNDQIEKMEDNFFVEGEITEFHGLRNLKQVIENFLKPMGLLKRQGQGYRLQVKPRQNPLLQEFFQLLEEEKNPLSEIYWQLRKGPYGLGRKQFRLLVLILLYSGYITAYSEKQKINLKQISIHRFAKIKYLGYGEIIAEEFQQVLQNCTLLPPRFKEQPFSLPLQQEIWDFLIRQKSKLRQRLNNLQFKLGDLQERELFSDFDFKKMTAILQEIRDMLEEIKVSYPSDEGLERFASSYRNRPHVDRQLNQLDRMDDFFNREVDNYRRMRSYLQQIPEEAFSELKDLLKNLQGSLIDQELIFNQDFLEEVKEGFARLQKLYAEKYFRKHQQQLAPDRFAPYKKMQESRIYQILAQFSDLHTISVQDDLVKIKRKLATVLRQQCDRLQTHNLHNNPFCECGFKPADEIELPAVKKLRQMVENGIYQYLQALKSEENREKIEEYLDNMEAVGKKRFARPIRELLRLDKAQSDLLKQLDNLLNRNLIQRINQALGEDISIVERNLDSLYENLLGRTFSPDQLQDVFSSWLEGSDHLNEKTYIKIKGRDANTAPETDIKILEAYLNDYFPDLLLTYDRLGSKYFSLLLVITGWQKQYRLTKKQLEQLAEIVEKDIAINQIISSQGAGLEEMLIHLQEKNQTQVLDKIVSQVEDLLDFDKTVRILADNEFEGFIAIIRQERYLTLPVKKALQKTVNIVENRGVTGPRLLKAIQLLAEAVNVEKDSAEEALIVELTYHYLQLSSSLKYLEKNPVMADFNDWEDLYNEHLAELELHLVKTINISRSLTEFDRLPLQQLQERAKKVIGDLENEFQDFLQESSFMVKKQGESSEILDIAKLVTIKFPDLLDRLNCRQGYLLLLDGLRRDIWQQLQQMLKKEISLRVIEEGSLLAYLPTNTETQLEKIRQANFTGKIISPDEFQNNREDIVKFAFIDDSIHLVKSDYQKFLEEIKFQAANRLLPFLKKLPTGCGFLVFSDHGYRINYSFQKNDKFDSPRYLHGGDTIFERLVPWTMFYKV